MERKRIKSMVLTPLTPERIVEAAHRGEALEIGVDLPEYATLRVVDLEYGRLRLLYETAEHDDGKRSRWRILGVGVGGAYLLGQGFEYLGSLCACEMERGCETLLFYASARPLLLDVEGGQRAET